MHIPYKDNKQFTGTARYCSINSHLGIEITRRDDLESLGYILIYFLTSNLPWKGLICNSNVNQHEKIKEAKLSTPIEVLCKGLPGSNQ